MSCNLALCFSKEMIVYRLLRDGEDVSKGIVQRNPKSKASVIDHIVGGKGNWWAGTKYISFCNSMDAIMSFARKTERYGTWTARIAEVDTNTLPEKVEVIDLSSKDKRNAYISKCSGIEKDSWKFRRFEERAEASKEVLLVGTIPPENIKILSEAIQSNILFRLLRQEEVNLIENGDSITAKSLLSETSVFDHVTLGSQTKASKYISTCATLENVQDFVVNLMKSNKTDTSMDCYIAKIDINKLIQNQFELIDLGQQDERKKYIGKTSDKSKIEQFHKMCDKHRVILVVGHIPSSCIELLKVRYNSKTDEWTDF